MPQIAISIVNLNCLEHTKNLIMDLDRQSFSDFVVYLYDQASTEEGTEKLLKDCSTRPNYIVIQNGENKPLNHIWNDFANESHGAKFICFLNNDIRIPSNYLLDSVNVLNKDSRVGLTIHATNNPDYKTATSPTRHILESTEVKQGWEFMLRTEDWCDIPEVLKFYCGDDFIFHKQYAKRNKIGVITSSPVIHKLSQTRESMGTEFTENIKKQALEDIENYKKLGFPHKWNNLTKYSRIEQELKQIIEISSGHRNCNFVHYDKRLDSHLKDVSNIDGPMIDVGVTDQRTFELILDHAISQDKQVIGIDYAENLKGEIVISGMDNRAAKAVIKSRNPAKFKILNEGLISGVHSIEEKASFIFVGILNSQKLQSILPRLWKSLQPGGTLFFPYYHYNTCQDCTLVIDEFFKDKRKDILCSRMQTKPGVKDTYLVVKNFEQGIEFEKRTKPLIVASVLKLGGIYDETYVNKLASAVKRHMPEDVDYEFHCLTDSTSDALDMSLIDRVIPLEYNLKGWWSKMELFRPELFGDSQVLYFDLDTLIVDDIGDFASYGGNFLALRDFNTLVSMGSGILSWKAQNYHHIFYTFIRNMISGNIKIQQFQGGDQEAIEYFLGHKSDWVQDVFPYKMAAFKYQCYDEKTNTSYIPEGCSVICFHSKPKMSDLKECPVIKHHWV